MRRSVPPLIVLSVVALVVISALSAPTARLAGPAATTPTRAIYAPLIAKPEPPTATSTATATQIATPTATQPVATATPTDRPPTFDGCQEDPLPSSAPNYPIRIVSINKDAETVTLQNVGAGPISLSGWHICSITGNQEQQGIGGTLAQGETHNFVNPGGAIWSNSSRDDGALYNANGSLISYHVDQ